MSAQFPVDRKCARHPQHVENFCPHHGMPQEVQCFCVVQHTVGRPDVLVPGPPPGYIGGANTAAGPDRSVAKFECVIEYAGATFLLLTTGDPFVVQAAASRLREATEKIGANWK